MRPPAATAPSETVPRDYTPAHLADKILRAKSALEGERKNVTVLFADVKGSMALAEQIDPEEWHEILDRFFRILTDGVHRFEGTVNQYTGDGIMALFGAPIAHEDHAQRACYAALLLRQALRAYADELRVAPGLNFAFRLGLNSGEVVVGKIGDDLRMDYTAQGYTVGLAQRMEQLAPADGVAVSGHTQRLVDGFFHLRALGPALVKGSRVPVDVFVLEDVGHHRTRLDVSRARGLSRFVGRGEELAALETALSRALDGSGRVAAIIGEAGVGKSRLSLEFVERCRARGLAVYEAHCPPHGRSIPYLPLLELLRNLFGIRQQDGPREARQKIAGELALLDDAFATDRALVVDFLGVSDPSSPPLQLEAEVRQRRLFAFLRRLLHRRTEAEPIVMLVDDLHWIDPGSDRFLAQIVEAVRDARALLLVNFRPEYNADWTRQPWVLQLPVTPLQPPALAELVRDWVGNDTSVAALPDLIAARSGGNPFFAEEIVLSLVETGRLEGVRGSYRLETAVDSIQVPTTVRSLLASRIDRLMDREKQLLYTAAVIGKTFSRPLLEAVIDLSPAELDAALSALLEAEIVFEQTLYPVAEYAFKHPLTYEVALTSQLREPRSSRHAAVARAIQAANAERLDEHAGRLAHHWTEAADPLTAAGWHTRAARWVGASDLHAARRHWAAARALLTALPPSEKRTRLLLEVHPELIAALHRLGAKATESDGVFQEALDLARTAQDRRAEARIESIYGWLRSGLNDWPGAIEHAEAAIALADAEADLPIQLFARQILLRTHFWREPLRKSIGAAEELLQTGGSEDAAAIVVLGSSPYLYALSMRATALGMHGRLHEGLILHERVRALAAKSGQKVDTTEVLADAVWTCWGLGIAEKALRFTSESLQTAERSGSEWSRVYSLMANGVANALARRWTDGLAFFDSAHQVIDVSGVGLEWAMMIRPIEALCRAGAGDFAQAKQLAREGVEKTRAAGTLAPHVAAAVLRARVLREFGDDDCRPELQSQITTAFTSIERAEMWGWLPLLLLERAGLARQCGDALEAARDLATARNAFARTGVTGWEDYAKSIEAG